jgi:hypothetical protein
MGDVDSNIADTNYNDLQRHSFRNELGDKTVRAVKIDGQIGYLAFDSIIREIISGTTFDNCRSYINGGGVEVLEFTEADSIVAEVQISYGYQTWNIKEFFGSLLLENGDYLLKEDGGQLVLEG